MAEYEAKQVYVVECPARGCPAPHKVVRSGWQNDIQRYSCRGCGKRFSASGKALDKQFPAEQIADAVDMYYSGMSYKQVAENMEDAYDVPEPSKAAVHAWVKGYTGLALRYLRGEVGEDGTPATATGKRIQADVGPHWVTDEMVVRVGGRKMWNWNIMDKDTRYILATRLSRTRNTNDAIALFEEAKANAQQGPETITTDGLGSYVDAVRAVFPKTKHVVSQGIHKPVNNNRSERPQGSFRQRIKTMRGMEARRTGQDYLDGWTLDYNFFKDHEAHDGGTPAEAAGVAQQVPWRGWEDITRLGGEVAEVKVKEHTPVRKKAGRKPKIAGVEAAVREYLEGKRIAEAHAKRKGKGTPAVAPFPAKRKGKRVGGRGRQGMKPMK